MQIGMIGLGKMGGNMAERLRRAGHDVVGYDRDPKASDVASLAELKERLAAPRAVWVMVPAGEPTRQTINELNDLLEPGDLVIDGGNSHYVDDQEHAKTLGGAGIHFIDAGVSGGVWGLQNGYGLMVGGDDEDVRRVMPIFQALLAARPAVQGAQRGSGPGEDPRRGPGLGRRQVDRPGGDRPRSPYAVITAALFARFASRQDDSPAMKVVAALRNQFGGHAVTASGTDADTTPAHPAP